MYYKSLPITGLVRREQLNWMHVLGPVQSKVQSLHDVVFSSSDDQYLHTYIIKALHSTLYQC